jgi:hypothetical protein
MKLPGETRVPSNKKTTEPGVRPLRSQYVFINFFIAVVRLQEKVVSVFFE